LYFSFSKKTTETVPIQRVTLPRLMSISAVTNEKAMKTIFPFGGNGLHGFALNLD
jgi:hypothetical protein